VTVQNLTTNTYVHSEHGPGLFCQFSIDSFKRSPMGIPVKLGSEHACWWHNRSWL